ncbi:MAG: D-alanyl-D-alanine carboxypeptidase [Actinomycetota bacterium]|nr:D-alanyl-D-alanine carboxypeptidase [Actinomycetota bacterium]
MRIGINLAKGAATLVTLAFMLVLASESTLDRAVAQETATQLPPGAPRLNAGSWALVDADTGLYLAGKDPDKQVAIASTTKVMVALVALEERANLNEEVTVSENAASYAGSVYSNVGLYPYDSVSVRELLTAALVPSGTDAVYALAEHLGGGSVDQFVGKMNEKAKSMGLKNTRFENPAGLDTRGNYSSARDLTRIVREAMKYPEFREIVGMSEASITTQDRRIDLVNTNLLVVPNSGFDYPPATGAKTGTSPQAGPCLIATATSGEESYVAVVLDAAEDLQRFEAARAALEYGFGEFGREALVRRGTVHEELQLPFRREESVKLVAAKSVSGLAGPGLEVKRDLTTQREAPPAAEAGRKLGEIEVLVDGRSVGSSPLVAQKGYEEAGIWQRVKYWSEGLKQWVLSR